MALNSYIYYMQLCCLNCSNNSVNHLIQPLICRCTLKLVVNYITAVENSLSWLHVSVSKGSFKKFERCPSNLRGGGGGSGSSKSINSNYILSLVFVQPVHLYACIVLIMYNTCAHKFEQKHTLGSLLLCTHSIVYTM